MTDVLRHRGFEAARLAHQRKSIEINVLDQRAQLADFKAERKALAERRGALEVAAAEPLDLPDDATEGDGLRAQKAVLELEREVLGVAVRLAEIEDLTERYGVNIGASESALKEIDAQLAALEKEENDG